MFEILVTVIFLWFSFQVLKLSFRITWSLAKLLALGLLVLSLPALIGCLLLAGGFLLLIPVGMIVLGFVILKFCL